MMVFPPFEGFSYFFPHPIILVDATIQPVCWQNYDNVFATRDDAQDFFIEVAGS
jgi:hypothetical protein